MKSRPRRQFTRHSRRVFSAEALEPRITLSTFTVTTINDSGPGSFRQALTDASSAITDDTISFDTAGVFSTPQTISLLTALPPVPSSGGALTVTGPGASRLTIRRDTSASNFRIFEFAGSILNISGLTISGGAADKGGGLFVSTSAANITLDAVTISGNAVSQAGGGIYLNSGAFLTVRNSIISANTAASDAGGIYFFNGGSLVVDNSTIFNNGNFGNGFGYGGGIYFSGAVSTSPPAGFTPSRLIVRNSIINTNSASSGGGICLLNFTGTLEIQNSTVVANNALTAGGGIFLGSGNGSILLRNNTLAGNSTDNFPSTNPGGGGIARTSTTAGSITVQNSVISGNTNTKAPDILASAATTTNVNFSAIGSQTGFNLSATSGNNLPFGADLMLGSLMNNGGNTLSRLPQPGSPLINAGSNAAVPTGLNTDQRGSAFDRIFGPAVDIGSLEVQPEVSGIASGPDVTTVSGTEYSFTVTYSDNHAVDVSSVIGNNTAIRVSGPGGYNVPANFVSIDNPTNGTPRTATYTISPPGGSWDLADGGTYTVSLQSNQVSDVDHISALAAAIGRFSAAFPENFFVTNANDSGPGSLRQAMLNTLATASADTITFDTAGVFASPQTIVLLGSLPDPTNAGGALTILGPGASMLTLHRDPSAEARAIFLTGAPSLSVSGLSITGGHTNGLGGVFSLNSGELVLDNVILTGNSSAQGGGAIASGAGGFVIIRNSVISGNSSNGKGGGLDIGQGSFIIDNSTISNNSSLVSGSGIYWQGIASATPPPEFIPGSLLIRNSTISGNNGGGTGGGISLESFIGTLRVQNSTITGNSGAYYGGGIGLSTSGNGSIVVQNSTIAGNSANGTLAGYGGGGIGRISTANGSITISNSVISGNSNATAPDIFASSATTTNVNYSAIGSATGFTMSASSGNNLPFGTNLLLGPLANNGGPTQSMLPQSGSPLINAGSNPLIPSGITTDQRGFPRIIGQRVDIGAAEYVIPGDLNFDGSVSIADFITLAANFNKTNMGWPDGDLNGDTNVSIADFIELASHFGQSLPIAAAAPQPPADLSITRDTPFSATRHTRSHRAKHHHPRPHLLFRFEQR